MRRHIFKHLLKMSFELPADLRRSLVFAWHYWTIYFVFDCLNSVTGTGWLRSLLANRQRVTDLSR